MSLRTQGLILFWIFHATSPFAFAGEGLEQMNRANNDFFKAAMDSPDKSKATIGKFKEQIVDPATKKGTDAERKSVAPGSDSGSSSVSYSSGSSNASAPVSEPIMDSKDVPTELEFPGAAAAAPKPAVSTKPATQRR